MGHRSIAESYRTLPAELRRLFPEQKFINGQSAFQPNSEFFIDADHLNARGVKKFNSWLLDTLITKHFFD